DGHVTGVQTCALPIFFASAQRKRFLELRRIADVEEDVFLYGQVCEYRDDIRVRAYLHSAPLKTMSKEVEAYLEYLRKIRGQLPLDRKSVVEGKRGDVG